MRKILYLILLFVSTNFLLSCSKGGPVQDPQFGDILLSNSLSEDLSVVKGEDNKLLKSKESIQLKTPSVKTRFRFYAASSLLLDTLLSVQAYEVSSYTLFKPTINANLQIIDSEFNGLNNEISPDKGFVKLSIANFSKSLPGKVNIEVFTTTYTPFSLKTIQVGQMSNVSSSFSSFQSLLVGVDQSSKPINVFTLTVKDPISDSILTTIPLTLPYGINADNNNQLAASVYLVYLNEQSVPSILMSK